MKRVKRECIGIVMRDKIGQLVVALLRSVAHVTQPFFDDVSVASRIRRDRPRTAAVRADGIRGAFSTVKGLPENGRIRGQVVD